MKIFRMIALSALLIVSLFSCSLDNPVIEKEQTLQTAIQTGTGLDPSRYYVFDDIIYDRTEPVHRNAIAELTGQLDTSRGLKINTHTLWPNGVVNYYFGNTFTSTEKAVIARAMKTIELACAVRFVLTTTGDYRYKISKITSTTIGGQSTLGYIKSPFCELASVNYGTTMHEFLHGLAISHEHNRPDRPVTINTANINPDYLSQFNIVSSTSATTYYEYDYDSIMHYGAYAFSINGKKTIEAGTNTIGQRDHLSVNDRRTLLTLYPFPANKYFRLKNRCWTFLWTTANHSSNLP